MRMKVRVGRVYARVMLSVRWEMTIRKGVNKGDD